VARPAVAAGFAVVGGAAVVFGVGREQSSSAGGLLAGSAPTVLPVSVGSPRGDVAPLTTPPMVVVSGQMLRDTQLDRYLQAHRQGLGPLPAAVPARPVRSIEAVSLER
jgi:hypothetical protein